jgi:hypothetical protein
MLDLDERGQREVYVRRSNINMNLYHGIRVLFANLNWAYNIYDPLPCIFFQYCFQKGSTHYKIYSITLNESFLLMS